MNYAQRKAYLAKQLIQATADHHFGRITQDQLSQRVQELEREGREFRMGPNEILGEAMNRQREFQEALEKESRESQDPAKKGIKYVTNQYLQT